MAWPGIPFNRREVRPQWYGVFTWTPADEAAIGAQIGSAASQAVWEAYAFLIALRLSLGPSSCGRVAVFGDAEGIMKSMITFSSRSPQVNAIAREAALMVAPLGIELAAFHIWSEENDWADALSRVAEGATIPEWFVHVECVDRAACKWQLLG